MPETITVMYWNVQDLGTDSPERRGDFTPICKFIAGLTQQNNVDVFCLMESRESFVPHLPTLAAAMDDAFKAANKDSIWFYDWIPGSIEGKLQERFAEDDKYKKREVKKRKTANYEDREDKRVTPTKFDELAYTQTGHYEGYVIFWNEDSTAFDIVSRASGPSGGVNTGLPGNHAKAKHAINLVFEGRKIKDWIPVQGVHAVHYQLGASGFSPSNPAGTTWAKLDFTQRREASGHWYQVRRPAYCTLSVKNQTGNNQYLPIVVFHAPSSEGAGAFGGADRCGMSRQMYEAQKTDNTWTMANRVVAGGDFNVSTQHEYDYIYATFTANRGTADNTGAGCRQFVPARKGDPDADLSKSIVRVQKPSPQGGGFNNMVPILPPPGQDNNDLYRSLAVDNIFTRGFTSADPPKPDYQVYNLQVELQANKSDVAKLAKTAFYQFIRGEAHGKALDATGNPVWFGTFKIYSNILDYPQLMAQLNARHFTSARRTAEFTNTFLSDHMPLIVRVKT